MVRLGWCERRRPRCEALGRDRTQDICGANNATLAEDSASAGRRHHTSAEYRFTSRTEVILPSS
jgi:hypothetical protein